MTNTVGGNIEQKAIGLKFGVTDSGTFENTELKDGIVTLTIVEEDWDNNSIFSNSGHWTSEVIDIGDNFNDYGKIFTSFATLDNYTTVIESRTSSDGIDFEEWKVVDGDGTINSTKNQFIQVKVTLYAELVSKTKVISNFDNAEDVNKFENKFIDTSDGLKLKKEYELEMTKDTNWTDEGSVFTIEFKKSDWLKINDISL